MAHRRWYVDSCSYSLRSETLSAGVLFKTCGIMLRPDADVSLPRQSLLFSEDEELGRFSLKSIKPSYPFLITILWPIGYCRTVLILVHQSNVGHAPFSTGGIRYALEGPHESEAEAEPG